MNRLDRGGRNTQEFCISVLPRIKFGTTPTDLLMLRHRLPAGPCQVTACNKKVALGETGKGLAKDDTIHVRTVLKGAYSKQECVGV
jgi:hypothetical protein